MLAASTRLAPGILLFPLLSTAITSACCCAQIFFFNMGQTQHMESTLLSHLHGATFLAFCDRYSKTWSLSRTLRNLNSWSSKVQATPPDQVVSSQNGCGSYPWLGHTCPSLNQAQCLPQEGRKKGGGTLS